MDRRLVARTRFQGLRRIGFGGRHAQDSWYQLDGYLRSRLGDESADLFAEPVAGVDGSMDWYASGETDPVPLSSLPQGEQEKLLARMQEVYRGIEEDARRLSGHSDPSQRRLAAVLQAALSFAQAGRDEPPLYSIDGRPVLVNWGTRLDAPEAPSDPLKDFVTRVSKPPLPAVRVAEPPPPVVEPIRIQEVAVIRRAPFDWMTSLVWLLLALLVATLFFMLLRPCGINFLTGQNFCPGVIARQTTDLQAEIDTLEQKLAEAPSCSAADDFAQRREEAGAQIGAVSITLAWDDSSDLDLIVECADGKVINYNNKQACGGVLDVDANARQDVVKERPAEHVSFPAAPTAGKYKVMVRKFVQHKADCPTAPNCPLLPRWYRTGPIPFQVEVSRNGNAQVFKGQVGDGQVVPVTEF